MNFSKAKKKPKNSTVKLKNVRIEGWAIVVGDGVTPYTAPEFITQHILGRVYNHPDFPDNYLIKTSKIVARSGDRIVTKSGTLYELGRVRPDYGMQYKDAKQRLLQSLQEVK